MPFYPMLVWNISVYAVSWKKMHLESHVSTAQALNWVAIAAYK